MRKLAIRLFVHSLRSDWNHGNAHFLRGLARALAMMGHDLRCYEPRHGWSLDSLLATEGERGRESVTQFRAVYPELDLRLFDVEDAGFERWLEAELAGAEIVVVHEWVTPPLVQAILAARDRLGFKALFHDTHHRASSNPAEMERLGIGRFDGVLAFGAALAALYRRLGMPRVWTFHEAADETHFRPLAAAKSTDVVWIGNWGDEERTREIAAFLLEPAAALPDLRFEVHGVRYPESGLAALALAGVNYSGYLPNLAAPEVYGRSRMTLHIPRQQYREVLAGIPTIRVFEALCCGIPLISCPWDDTEQLFRPGDFEVARSTAEMTRTIHELARDPAAAAALGERGRETVLARHTCRHRAEQLTALCEDLVR